MADVIFLFDRRWWPSMTIAWQEGLPSRAPDGVVSLQAWRDSAKRCAKHLDCTVRTGLREIDGHQCAVAVANGGYPLGVTDAAAKDAYNRHQAGDA